MTNAIAVTDQEHPDHQLGIDRGPPDVAVKRLQLLVQIGQNGSRENIDPSQQVVRRDHLVEAKLVKQLPLISVLPPHHRRLSCRFLSRNHCSLRSSTPFSTASVKLGNTRCEYMFSAVHPITDSSRTRCMSEFCSQFRTWRRSTLRAASALGGRQVVARWRI